MRRVIVVFTLLLATTNSARAELKVNSLFTEHAVLQRDKPIPVWGTATPGVEIRVTLDGKNATSAKSDDTGRWKVTLPSQSAGGPFDLTITGDGTTQSIRDVLIGDVWICSGQSNMEWPIRSTADPDWHIPAAKIPRIRLFQIPNTANVEPQPSVNASWKPCTPENASRFSAVAYYFGRNLYLTLDVPIGLIQTAWGGTPAQAWTSREALDNEPILRHYYENFSKRIADYNPEKAKAEYEAAVETHKAAVAKAKEEGTRAPATPQLAGDPRLGPNPSTLYNGMIHPLIPYAFRGAIWYQGESNGSRGFEYRTLFPTMIKDWRSRWGQDDFPFLCVQLAPFGSSNPDGPEWAELREAQALAAKVLPNVGMAVITDVGEKNDIHPPKKEPVGARLALLARKIAYGEDLIASGPTFNTMTITDNKAVLSFDHVGAGLVAKGGPLTDFTVCGEDQQFVPAKAEIKAGTVIVWSDDIEKPIAVRYGWRNCPECNLFNRNGLPASPFRTDDFPLKSAPKP